MPDYLLPTPTASPFDDANQYLPVLLTAVDSFLDVPGVFPEADETDALGYMEDLKAWLSLYFPGSGSGGSVTNPTITLWHDQSTVINGSPLSYYMNYNSAYGQTTWQNPAADGDVFEQVFAAPAGTYSLFMLSRKIAAGADVTLKIDGSTITTWNLTSGSNVFNNLNSTTGIVLTDGTHTLRGEISRGGNNYYAPITKFWLVKTS